ncbi:MAG: hypothetical protein A3F84_13525 [Candidatus Handelsmanbacteria bacterium RIFCSPLOWO2_12_FULL_64_10]|uniref:Peptidyl-prolyl cis-trans isomerase n=1 Tax=Handelsmanbacteria sp. (strain RIFCSPLOWO2_12_FULL_64_10) TaxID=1817868 RepID=A0A1F6CAW8_HANXR|nr:MAG: hypothetical protein A3F84_13525 [Candidatus Handelsmanbacteria bacterium RIFCSPLOWO2_12_FULL_64_10]
MFYQARLLAVPLLFAMVSSVACAGAQQSARSGTEAATQPPSGAPAPVVASSSSGGAALDGNAPGVPELKGTIQTAASGLRFLDEKVGQGAVRAGQQVTVHYTGWLTNGQKFDSSRDRGQPFTFPLGLGRVIRGWDEGVATMQLGGKRRLIIPAELGYGSQGAGALIPPNSVLIFDVELLSTS